LSYLDAIIEQQIPMTAANMFWLDTLHDCNLDRSLPLPYDRYRLSNEHRTCRGTSISFDFGQDLSSRFLAYASSNNIQAQHLVLACYYVVLFKLTNGERDLCIGMNVDNRYRDELKSIIGIFENIIPLRCQLDPHWSFQQLLTHIQEMMTDSLEYSYFPLQRILAQHPNVLKPAFINTFFEFHPTGNEHIKNGVLIGSNQLHTIPISVKLSADRIISDLDFALIIQYDLNVNQLSCTINASLELFDGTTVATIAQRFHSILYQLFQSANNNQMKKPIYELSLTLSNEKLLIQSLNNTEVSFPSATCIHHEFVLQVMDHPQKLAVELDDQSLTYSELLYYVQLLSLNFLNIHGVISGEIICQCVERSLSMVSLLDKQLIKRIKYRYLLGHRHDGN
jgi:non-ribosomal peptide synthetase component F